MTKRVWTFGHKLGFALTLVMLLTLLMGTVGLLALRSVVAGKDEVILNTGPDLIDAERLRAAMQREIGSTRGFLLTQDPRYLEDGRAANVEFTDAIDRIRTRGVSSDTDQLLNQIVAAKTDHVRESARIIEQRRRGEDIATVVIAFEEHVRATFESLAAGVAEFVSESEIERENGRKAASATAWLATSVLIGVGIGTVLLTATIALVLARTLNHQISASVHHIRSASAELQAAAGQQASGAREQSTSMSEITTTMGELLATSRQIAESGQHVAKMAANSAERARSGQLSVDKARDAVGSIRQQVDAIVHHMLNLGKKSQQIGGILDIINELAEQTNILAINATIEAAVAGDSGRRFAVVGEEIRKLADRVGGSTKQVRGLIEEIRAAVNATVMATETGSKTVEMGTERFAELQDSFMRIGEIVGSTMEAGKEIELSTKQQATAVEQVNLAISNVAQASRETEASSAQTLQTASELTSLSGKLAQIVHTQAGLAAAMVA